MESDFHSGMRVTINRAVDLSLCHRSGSIACARRHVVHRIPPAFWREGGPQGRAEGIWGNDPGVLGLAVRSV
jgi:hypothetical protein